MIKKLVALLILSLLFAGSYVLLKEKVSSFSLKPFLFPGQKVSPPKKFKIGIVHPGGAYKEAVDGLLEGLEEKGYSQSSNLTVLLENTEGNTEKTQAAIEKIALENPDLVHTISTPVTTQAQKTLGDRLPVVFNIVGDPIGAGFARSYAVPETNYTGCSNLSAELSGKRLEIFAQAFPNLKRWITFYNPENKFSRISIENSRKATGSFGVDLQEILVRDKNELAQVLQNLNYNEFDAFFITPDSMVISNVDLIFEKSTEFRKPAMGHEQTLAKKGAVLTFGADFRRLGVQCASVVASVLSGQRPQGIPIVTPAKLDIVVNLKKLDEMQIQISPNILKEADLVIR